MGLFIPILINCSQEIILLETDQKEKLFCHIPHKKFTKDPSISISIAALRFFPITPGQTFVILT